MKTETKTFIKNKWFIVLYVVFFFIVVFNLFMSHLHDTQTKFESFDDIPFDKEWHYEYGDGVSGYTSLPHEIKKSTSRYLTLTNTLPTITKTEYFIFRARHTYVKVLIDGVVVYDEISQEEAKNEWYTLQGINYISVELEPSLSGKTIEVVSYSSEMKYLSAPGEGVIIDRGSFMLNLIRDKFLTVICLLIMSVIGALLVLLWFVTDVILKQKNKELLCLGLFTISMALWLTTESQLAQFFFRGTKGLTTLAYEILILIPVPIGLFFTYASVRKKTYRLSQIAVLFELTWFVVFNCLHFMKICSMPNALIVTQLLIGVEIFFIGYIQITEFMYIRKISEPYEKKVRSLPLYGIAIIVPLALLEVSKYVIHAINSKKTDGLSISIGIIAYILSLAIESVASLAHKNAKLQETTDMKSQFLANMSHEIRTPLNAVLGFNEAILQSSNVDKIHEYSLKIQHSGDTLKGIINSILDISKIEAGKLEIASMEYSMLQMLDNITSMMETLAKQKDLKLVTDIDSNIPEILIGDEQHLRQVIINIMNNAIKYTPSGTVTLRVKLVEKRIDSPLCKILFSVVDTGPGIKPDDQKKLFDKFERIGADKNSNAEGTGLGMSIVLQTLRAMNSEIQLESTYGKGSNFFFELEQCVVNDAKLGDFQNRRKEVAMLGLNSTDFIAPDAKVLIVDDVQMNLDAALALLEFTQMRVDTALSGQLAIEAVKKERYDLIFMDHMMPGMDGIEATTIIRNLAVETSDMYYASVPIIALTANAMVGMKEQFQMSGMMDLVSKPIELPALIKCIKTWLPKEFIKARTAQEMKNKVVSSLEGDGNTVDEWNIEIPNINVGEARQYTVNFNSYEKNLNTFFKTYKANREEIQKYADANDVHDYVIKVHGLKSTSKMIGAMELSEKAKELEAKGNEGELSLEETAILFEIYDKVVISIGEFLGVETESEDDGDCISIEEYDALINRIKNAAVNFDAMEFMTLDEELGKIKVPVDKREEFEKICGMVTNMSFGDIADYFK